VLSSKPTRVAADIAIDLPYPRDVEGAGCAAYRQEILRHLQIPAAAAGDPSPDSERTT
jgi:hypothetical protein